MIFKRALLFCVTQTVLLIMDVKVEAFKSGCSGGYCFVISDYTKNSDLLDQFNAQQRCQSNRTQLVEIRNKDIQDSLVDFIRSVYSQGLNGQNVFTNGKRSPGNWIRLSANGIGSLTVLQQTDASYAYGYLKSTTSGFDLFASRPTDNIGGFICTGLSDCSGGVTISSQCYRSFTETLSWYEARNRCLNGGGDLASFEHITSNAGLNALNGSWISPRNSYWIGIRREWWTWQSTNSDVKYSEWIAGHPLNEVSRSYTDCLCVSTNEWKWTECGCSQQLPFICISGQYSTTPPSDTKTSTKTTTTTTPTTTYITTSTTTRPTTSTIRSTITAFTTKDTSKATSHVTSEGNGVSTPTTPATVTSNSTSAVNNTESLGQSIRLSREATIGIGVGVGVGGALVIVALVAAIILLCRKRCPLRCPRRKKTDSKAQRPHVATQDSKNNDHSSDGMECLYASVVPSSPKQNNADTNALENSNETSTVYAQLGFHKVPSNHRDGSVIIVPGKTKPSPVPKPPATNGATKKCNVGDDINTGDTMA